MGFFRGFGMPELLIILVIILLLFGATRLPRLAGSMGKAVKEFRKGTGGAADTPSSKRRRPPRGTATKA